MNQYTKESPGCYHSMIKYLAEINNTSIGTFDKICNIRDLYHKPDAKKAKHRGLKYKSYDILVYFEDRTCDFIVNSQRFDHWIKDIPTHFMCARNKRINEFDIKPIHLGKSYNDSLGNGWYQKVDLYQIDDKFFALMDCTC